MSFLIIKTKKMTFTHVCTPLVYTWDTYTHKPNFTTCSFLHMWKFELHSENMKLHKLLISWQCENVKCTLTSHSTDDWVNAWDSPNPILDSHTQSMFVTFKFRQVWNSSQTSPLLVNQNEEYRYEFLFSKTWQSWRKLEPFRSHKLSSDNTWM